VKKRPCPDASWSCGKVAVPFGPKPCAMMPYADSSSMVSESWNCCRRPMAKESLSVHASIDAAVIGTGSCAYSPGSSVGCALRKVRYAFTPLTYASRFALVLASMAEAIASATVFPSRVVKKVSSCASWPPPAPGPTSSERRPSAVRRKKSISNRRSCAWRKPCTAKQSLATAQKMCGIPCSSTSTVAGWVMPAILPPGIAAAGAISEMVTVCVCPSSAVAVTVAEAGAGKPEGG
jgi:hypothetical protein